MNTRAILSIAATLVLGLIVGLLTGRAWTEKSKWDVPPGVVEVKANICMRGRVVQCDCWTSGNRTLCNNCKVIEGPCNAPGGIN
jgi:hypothetical protein